MKSTVTQWAAKAAGAGAVILLITTSATAQERGDWNRGNDNRTAQSAPAYRDGGYGSYGSNDGYRVRDERNDRRDQRAFLRGRIERVDFRSGTIRFRDEASGRTITANVNGRAMRNLRRGDRVELTGQWNRGGIFSAERVDNIRGRR